VKVNESELCVSILKTVFNLSSPVDNLSCLTVLQHSLHASKDCCELRENAMKQQDFTVNHLTFAGKV